MNWSAASNAEQAAQDHYNYQVEMAQRAIQAVQQDQSRWDAIVPELQQRLLRFTSGQFTAGEQAARTQGAIERAAPSITAGSLAINQQANASKQAMMNSLGARGLSQSAPGITARTLGDIETARTNTIGQATARSLDAATQYGDTAAINGMNSVLNRYGQRPSLAPAYSAAAGGAAPAGPMTLNVNDSIDMIWRGLSGMFKTPSGGGAI